MRLVLAAAIVIYNDCVLIVRRSKKESLMPRAWGVPCGKIDKGEGSFEEAVLREVLKKPN